MIETREYSPNFTVDPFAFAPPKDATVLPFQLVRKTWNAMLVPIFGDRWRVPLVAFHWKAAYQMWTADALLRQMERDGYHRKRMREIYAAFSTRPGELDQDLWNDPS